ncbi:hypothetical protein [Marinobacter sp. NFXS11]
MTRRNEKAAALFGLDQPSGLKSLQCMLNGNLGKAVLATKCPD